MKGRNSTVVSIRISDSIYATLQGLAEKRGVSVSVYIKQKVQDFVSRLPVNTTNVSGEGVKVVNTTKFVMGMDGHLVKKEDIRHVV